MTPDRHTFTDLNALFRGSDKAATVTRITDGVTALGCTGVQVRARVITLACEPDNMLVAAYQQVHDAPPVTEDLHRITVSATVPAAVTAAATATAADTTAGAADITDRVTRAVVAALPTGPDGTATVWFGSTRYDEPNDDSDIPRDNHSDNHSGHHGDDRP
ncbi:hypothetical protein [Corynebacterium nuruki]|uniref:hypothetical protein n=2 Tax=Corynebacterium nuruki TaxID=1032851 RepID=UPI0002485DE8|nr:hypothetical protein [Corynebacterium nuruki]